MCGIAGIFRTGPGWAEDDADERARDGRVLRAMLAAIRHRGPDEEGTHESRRASVGVRRLSILDLAGGSQPLSGDQPHVHAGNNGELYNFAAVRDALRARGHAFRTQSDTEVLPHLYEDHGADAPRFIRGMFACFIVDDAAGRLVLARDRFGVKPLYYRASGDRLWFASELRSLLRDARVPSVVDPERFADYLALGYIPGDRTIYREIHRLPPGHRLVADDAGIRVEPYDLPGAFDRVAPRDDEEQIAELERLLAASAQSQLVSDVPLGLLLSGGIDSSALTSLLPETVRRELLTFCVGFEDGGRHDERAVARAVAARLGTRHVERAIQLDARAWFARAADHTDEPLADPAAVPALAIADAASEHVKVLLSGTGGDELFGGYRRYRLPQLRRWMAPLPKAFADRAAAALSTRTGSRRTLWGEGLVFAGKALEARVGADFIEAYLRSQAIARDAEWGEIRACTGPDPMPALVARVRELDLAGTSDEEAAFDYDRRFYLPDDLLLKEDRMTMACSVEGRVPFLDEDLAAFARALPLRSKIRGRSGKWILREVVRRRLGTEIGDRTKHGFSVPVAEWLRGPLKEALGDLAVPGASGAWKRDVARRWRDEHVSGARDRSAALWSVLVWESWWKSPSGPGGRGQGVS